MMYYKNYKKRQIIINQLNSQLSYKSHHYSLALQISGYLHQSKFLEQSYLIITRLLIFFLFIITKLMSQWSSKIKSLFNLNKQDEQQTINDNDSQQVPIEETKKQEGFFHFDIDNFFSRAKHQQPKHNLKAKIFSKIKHAIIHEQPTKNDQFKQKQVLTNKKTQQSQINHQQNQNLSSLNDKTIPNTTGQRIYQNLADEDQYIRDDDQDSLGYTENEWDEQTINFELEDRMLDCLQDQKHLSLYRQSLAQGNSLRKKIQQSLTKPNRPPSPKQNQLSEIQFQKIIQQHNTDFQHLSLKQKKPSNKQKKNRFSKYKKAAQNYKVQEKSLIPHFTPEQQEKLGRVYKQKVKELNSPGNETCQDYIARVFNLQPAQIIEKPEKFFFQKQISELQQTCGINDSIPDNNLNGMIQKKKESSPSDSSFQVVQEINHISIQQIHKTSSQFSASQHQLNNKCNVSQIQKHKVQFFPKSKENNQVELESKNEEIKLKDKQQKQNINNINNINETHILSPIDQKFKGSIDNGTQNINQTQKIFHILSPPRTKPTSFSNQSPIVSSKIETSIQNEHEHQFTSYKQKHPQIYKNSQIDKSSYLNPNKIPSKNSYMPTKNTTVNIIQPEHLNPFSKTNIENSYIENQAAIRIKGSPDIRFHAGKSPRAKIQFNYLNTQANNKNMNFELSNSAQIQKNTFNFVPINSQEPLKNQNVKILYLEPQPQERIPIFLQRLRRLISAYPNFYSEKINIVKIRQDLKFILNVMKSAISVIQLLYKKLKFQRNRLQQPLIKMGQCKDLGQNSLNKRKQLQDEIWDFFINSQWQSYKIEEIEYIKPKQKFKKRNLNPIKLDEALQMYNEFIAFYLKEPILTMKTQDQIKRYIRIRQKISQIVQYLRMISEDLYTYWLVECHYPYLYYEFLNYLKEENVNSEGNALSDQIYAKLVLAEQYKDPLSCSIIGVKILQKIRNKDK